jgi:hypothetical protein
VLQLEHETEHDYEKGDKPEDQVGSVKQCTYQPSFPDQLQWKVSEIEYQDRYSHQNRAARPVLHLEQDREDKNGNSEDTQDMFSFFIVVNYSFSLNIQL